MAKLIEQGNETDQIDDDQYKTEYFCVQKGGNGYFDPLNFAQYSQNMFPEQVFSNENEKDEDFDSQDSNKEDAEQNEYPEDANSDEYGEQVYKSDSSDYYGNQNDDREQDLPKNKMLKNSIFDKIFKSNKDWSYQNYSAQFKETGTLEDYEGKCENQKMDYDEDY